MEEYQVSENKVLEMLGKVSMAKKQAGMILEENDFGSQRLIQKTKKHNIVLVNIINSLTTKLRNKKLLNTLFINLKLFQIPIK